MATKQEEEKKLADHLSRLRCGNIAEYRMWCERNGLRATIRKPQHDLRQEIVLFERLQGEGALKAARQFERRPEMILRELASGKMPTSAYHRPYLHCLFGRFHTIRDTRH